MTRVMFAPLNYYSLIQDGMYDAFRELDCDLAIFDYFAEMNGHNQDLATVRRKFVQQTIAFNPDLLHLQIQHTAVIDQASILEIKKNLPNCIISNWTGDVRNYVPETYAAIAKVADYNLISSTGQIDMFASYVGRPIHYWQIGYNPKLYYPENNNRTNFDFDISFVANVNLQENYPGTNMRRQACWALKDAFGGRFGLFGDGWTSDFNSRGSVDQRNLNEVYHRSFCVLSISHYNQLSHYFSDRLLMCLASGRPTISISFPGWESYFTNNSDIIIIDSIEQIIAKVNELKNDTMKANLIGDCGASKVYGEHTYLSRVKELLKIVGLK